MMVLVPTVWLVEVTDAVGVLVVDRTYDLDTVFSGPTSLIAYD